MAILTEVECVLCESKIPVRPEERELFDLHMSKEHLAERNLNFLLVVCLLDEEERGAISQVISDRCLLEESAWSNLDGEHGDGAEENVFEESFEGHPTPHVKLEHDDEAENTLRRNKSFFRETKLEELKPQRNSEIETLPLFIENHSNEETLSLRAQSMELDAEQMKVIDKEEDGKAREVENIENNQAFIELCALSPSKKHMADKTNEIMIQDEKESSTGEQVTGNSFAEDLERWRKFVSELETGSKALEASPESKSKAKLDLEEILKPQRFKCDRCPVVCKFRISLNKHKMKNHINDIHDIHGPNELTHPFSESDESTDVARINDNTNSESQDLTNSCMQCSHKSKNAGSLKKHIKDIHERDMVEEGIDEQKEMQIEKEEREKIQKKGKLYEREVRDELEKNGKLICKICHFESKLQHSFNTHMRLTHRIRQRARRKDAWKEELRPSFRRKFKLKEESMLMKKIELETNLEDSEATAQKTEDEIALPKQDKTVSLRKGLESVPINKSWSSFLLGSIHSDIPKPDTVSHRTFEVQKPWIKRNPFLVKDNNKSLLDEDLILLSLKAEKGRCPKCDELKVNVRAHYLSVHTQGSFPCKDCDKTLTSAHKLSDHRHKKHPRNPKKVHRYSAI